MEQETVLEVLERRALEQELYSYRCLHESRAMRDCLTKIRKGEVDLNRLEKDATLTHTLLGQGEARRRELPGPGTIGAAVRKVMKELTLRKKGVPITNEEIITFTQVEMPHANPSSIKGYVYAHQNDIRRKRDIRNVGPGAWVLDESRQIEHKRKPTEDEVQDTVAMVIRANKDTGPFKGYTKGTVGDRIIRLMGTNLNKAWTNKELRTALDISEGALACLYTDIDKEDYPIKKAGPGLWQLKRARTEATNGKVRHINGTKNSTKKAIDHKQTPEYRAKMAKVMRESHKRRKAEKAAAEATKLEQNETVNA